MSIMTAKLTHMKVLVSAHTLLKVLNDWKFEEIRGNPTSAELAATRNQALTKLREIVDNYGTSDDRVFTDDAAKIHDVTFLLERLGLKMAAETALRPQMTMPMLHVPDGMSYVDVNLFMPAVCAGCGETIVRLARPTWLPLGFTTPCHVLLPSVDPDKRLQGLDFPSYHNLHPVAGTSWDYRDSTLNVGIEAVVVPPTVSEDVIALFIQLYREAGWVVETQAKGGWAKAWPEHHNKAKTVPCHGHTHSVCGRSPKPQPQSDSIAAEFAQFVEKTLNQPPQEPKAKKPGKKKKKKGDKDAD